MFSGRSENGSARGPPGFSARAAEEQGIAAQPPTPHQQHLVDRDLLSADGEEPVDQVLELEHMIGFTGRSLHTMLAVPRQRTTFVKSAGSAVVVADTEDPHQQDFLRGHDMEVTALAVSLSGKMLASGQQGTVHRKGFEAPVIVWDLETRRPLFTLRGLSQRVDVLRFSHDERLLAASGADRVLNVWSMETGELKLTRQFPSPVSMLQWGDINSEGRRNKYDLMMATATELTFNELTFDARRQQWVLEGRRMGMPTAGMTRDYTCACHLVEGDQLLTGTTVGDLLVFRLSSKVYRASVPVCSAGVRSVLVGENPEGFEVFCGGGDGSIRKLRGDDMRWVLQGECFVEGAVNSLTMVHGGAEMLCGTDRGFMYRVTTADLSVQLLSQAHTDRVMCTAFGTRSDVFASGSCKGDVKVWDLSDYNVLSQVRVNVSGGVASMCWIEDSAVVTGWEDTFIRCHDASSMALLWEIPRAHRGVVTSVAAHSDASLSYLLSGGSDGSVRVWALRSREMQVQFHEHKKGVSSVLVDVKAPNLVHSAGLDCCTFTYDLRTERRTVAHMTREGPFQDMTQRLDSEQELITCDNNGRLLFWDCDQRDPVQAVQSPTRISMACVSISPTGRYLAGSGDFMIIVFDLTSGIQVLAQAMGHSEPVRALQWSPDEKQIVSVGDDSCVCVWNFYAGFDALA